MNYAVLNSSEKASVLFLWVLKERKGVAFSQTQTCAEGQKVYQIKTLMQRQQKDMATIMRHTEGRQFFTEEFKSSPGDDFLLNTLE